MQSHQPLSNGKEATDLGTIKSSRSRKRIVVWILGGLATCALILVATGFFLLRNAWLHNYVLQRIQQEASTKLNTQVQLQNYALRLSGLRLDLYGLTIHGAPPQTNPPLLQVQHIGLGVRIVSIWHRKWYLDRLQIDSPVIQVFTEMHGKSNIPTLKSSGGGSSFSIFELGVRHATLDLGAIYFDDQKSALEADLHDLDFHSQFDQGQEKYSAVVSYQDGHLRIGSFQPIPHQLQAAFTATPDTFHLIQAKLRSGTSQVAVAGTLNDYRAPQVSATYNAEISGAEIAKVLSNPSIPVGTVYTNGSVSYRQNAGRPLLDLVAIDGELKSRVLNVNTPKLRTQINDISGHYTLANGTASVRNLQARILGGQLVAAATMRNLTGNTQSKLIASLHGLSLAAAQRLIPVSAATRDITLRGVMSAEANAAWGSTFRDLVVQANSSINGSISNRNSVGRLPVQSVIHGTYRAAGSQINLIQSYLKMPQTELDMNGTLSSRSNLAVQFHSKDLHELDTIASIVRSSIASNTVQPLGLAGTAVFQGTIHGSTIDPHIVGKLVAANVHFKGSTLPLIRSDIDLDRSHASLQHAKLEISSNIGQSPASDHTKNVAVGFVQFNGSVELSQWAFEKTSPIQLQLHASRLNIATLIAIAGSQAPVAGTLAADINLHGTEQNPIGDGNLAIVGAKVFDEPVQFVNAAFRGSLDSIHADLSAHAPAGVIHSVLTYRPIEQSYEVQLKADSLDVDKLRTLHLHSIEAKGQLSLDASGQGTVQNPGVSATVQIPQLEIQNQKIANVHLDMNVANHSLTASLHSQAIDTSIQARAKVNLSGNYLTEAKLDTQPIALGPLLALYAPSIGPEFTGQTEVHATVSGPIKQKDLLTASVILPVLRMAYGKSVQLAATSPVHVDYNRGVVALQRTTIQGTDTNLQLQGSVPIHGTAPVSVLLLGTVNLQLAQLFSPDVRSSGDVIFNINSYGARKDPSIEGEVAIVNANFSNGSLPIGLQHGNGVLSLTKDRLNIKSFHGDVGGGTLTAQGGISYRPTIQFDLGAAAKNIRMLYPQGLREELSADLRLAGNEENALLGGAVRVANVSFTPAFDLTSFIGTLSSGVTPPPTPGFSQNLHLNLAVSSTSGVSLVSRTLSLNGTANLQVRGTAAEPVILGRVNLNDGDVIFNGNRFVLNGGTVAFVNPTETQPVVNLTLNTTIQQYNIHLRFNGPVDQLRTNYASDPSLPSADIINLLAFGQTTEANAANPATPGNQAAEGLLASQVSSQITSRVSKVAGISQLSINPVLSGGSTQGPAGAIVTVQQRVTGNFFVTFSTNVATTQDQVIMGQYQLSPKVAITGTRDQNGGFAFDTIFKKSW